MEMPLAEIQRHLKTLRLHGINATLETRLIQANQGASFAEVFACMVQDELDWRNSRICEARLKASGLKEQPTLTEFDWDRSISWNGRDPEPIPVSIQDPADMSVEQLHSLRKQGII